MKISFNDAVVLVVDDEAPIRLHLKSVCENLGFTVALAESAEEALEVFAKKAINILLTDLKMSGKSGLDLAEQTHARFSSTAIIILTGFPSVKTAQQAAGTGAVSYLTKPVQRENLQEALNLALHWNIGQIIQKAAHKFLHMKGGLNRDEDARMTTVKKEIKSIIMSRHRLALISNFIRSQNAAEEELYKILSERFQFLAHRPW